MCAHGSMARMAGERLQTPTALLVRCGCVARATPRAPGAPARSLRERAARLFGCYVAQSRKSAWGHVSLFWYAGATAPLKRMAPFQWATVRVHMWAFVCLVRLCSIHTRPTRRHPAARGCDRAQSRSRSGTSGARTAVQSASSREPQTCRPNAPQRVLALHATPLARRHVAAPSPWSFASTDYNRRERCDPGAPRWRRRSRQVIALSRRLMGQRAQVALL